MIRPAVLLVCCLLLAGCTDDTASHPDRPAQPAEKPADEPTTSSTSPLTLAVHATREPAAVSTPQAQRLVEGGAQRWSAIGQPGGRLRVVAAPGVAAAGRTVNSPEAALDVVRTDPSALALVPASAVDPSVRVLPVDGKHPLRSPGTYPLRTRRGSTPTTHSTVTVTGDIMLGRGVAQRHDDPAAIFRPLAKRLRAADVTVANLESTLSRAGPPTQGGDSFAAAPSIGPVLRRAGFDVVSLANNHVGDYGETALRRTVRRIRRSGIDPVGAGKGLTAAATPAIIRTGERTIGFYATDSIGESPAATTTSPGTNRLDMPPRTGPLDEAALRRITADIRRLDERVDTVIVLPHWGTQYTHWPEPSQHRVARALARAGADVVAGGHPHWVQGWERIADTTVAHSLGNFVFDMDFMRQTQEGVFLEITLWDGEVRAVEPVPYVIGPDYVPRLARGTRASDILDDIWSTSTGAYARR